MYPTTPYINAAQMSKTMNTTTNANTSLVHRNVKQQQQQQQMNMTKSNLDITNANLNKTKMNESISVSSSSAKLSSQSIMQPPPPPPPHQGPPSSFAMANSARTLLPRPIVAPNRTFFDKLLDFVIGEGPNNR